MEIKSEEKKNIEQKTNPVIAIILVIAGFWIGWDIGAYGYLYGYLPYVREKEALKQVEKYDDYLKEIHKNDNIGGDTPEQTMDLFIDALKKGDMDLASKYFVAEEQEKWRKKITEITKEQLDIWLGKIEENKKNWRKEQQGESQYVIKYNTGVGDDEITHFIVLKKNINNKWKIGSF